MRGYDLPWQSLHLYPSDERCVPVGDPERNDRLIDELLVDQLTLPPANLHRIPAELGPEMGATQFSRLLRKTPPFDVVFLSAGPDGHTASLFPGHSVLADERSVVPVWGAPKPPPQRVSIGYSRLLAARQRIVMVTGSEKRELAEQVQRGVDLPVTRVQPTGWYLDGEAARVLRDNTENKISEMKGDTPLKIVILCGGYGTRIRDVSENIPKPMIPIGPYPIVWHIMKYYASFGHRDFILCLGHKGQVIKDFFLNYEAHTRDLTIRLGADKSIEYHTDHEESDWRVTLADTGIESAYRGPRPEDSEIHRRRQGLHAYLWRWRGQYRSRPAVGVPSQPWTDSHRNRRAPTWPFR